MRLLKSFWQRSASFPGAPGADNLGHWISLAQHYGLPTRVLDWSESFLVALYFATRDPPLLKNEESSEVSFTVWALNPIALNRAFLGDTLTTAAGGSHDVGICSEEDETISGYLLRAFGIDWPNGGQYDCVAYLPQIRYLRMSSQKAAFTWHQTATPLEESSHASNFLKKISYPASLRRRLAADLTLLGITHSSLFPDFEGVAAELKAESMRGAKPLRS